jgi:hypothetical protein
VPKISARKSSGDLHELFRSVHEFLPLRGLDVVRALKVDEEMC